MSFMPGDLVSKNKLLGIIILWDLHFLDWSNHKINENSCSTNINGFTINHDFFNKIERMGIYSKQQRAQHM